MQIWRWFIKSRSNKNIGQKLDKRCCSLSMWLFDLILYFILKLAILTCFLPVQCMFYVVMMVKCNKSDLTTCSRVELKAKVNSNSVINLGSSEAHYLSMIQEIKQFSHLVNKVQLYRRLECAKAVSKTTWKTSFNSLSIIHELQSCYVKIWQYTPTQNNYSTDFSQLYPQVTMYKIVE